MFIVLAGLAVLLTGIGWRALPESLPPERRTPPHLGAVLRELAAARLRRRSLTAGRLGRVALVAGRRAGRRCRRRTDPAAPAPTYRPSLPAVEGVRP